MKNAGCALLLGLLTIALVGYYWQRDEPLSEQALAWLDAVRTPTSGSRAFLLLRGLDAPAGHSVEQLGQARLDHYQARLAGQGTFPDAASQATLPLPGDPPLCSLPAPDCLQGLQVGAQLEAILDEHALLRARYSEVLRMTDYRTLTTASSTEPLPALVALSKGNQLLALEALQLSRAGQPEAALELLEADMRALRGWLARADQLILKMVVVQLLARDTETLLLLHRQGVLPRPAAQPGLSAPERSLLSALQREWAMVATAFDGQQREGSPASADQPLQALSRLLLYKPGMTMNASLPAYRRVAEHSALDAQGFRLAMLDRQAPGEVVHSWRNYLGSILLKVGAPDYDNYLGRLHDLDARFRLFNRLRLLQVDADPGEQDLAALAADNPYRPGEAPTWSARDRQLCYAGPLPDVKGLRCLSLP